MPIPGVMAGALSRRTKNAKIAVLGRALPLLNNPLVVAEEFAMLDNITGGPAGRGLRARHRRRVSFLGRQPGRVARPLPRGARPDHAGLDAAGPVQVRGQVLSLRIRELLAAARISSRIRRSGFPRRARARRSSGPSHPDRKYTYLQTFSPVAVLARYMNMYRETARNYGYEATSEQVGWAVPTYCAETDEIAIREARPHIEFFLNKLLRMPQEMLLPPGYLSLASMQGVMAAKRALSTGNQTIEDVIEKGVFLCGSPATLAREAGEISEGDRLRLSAARDAVRHAAGTS